MRKTIITIIALLSLYSCKKFDAEIKIEDHSTGSQSVLLINTSKDKKLKYTIKKTIKFEDGKEKSFIEFYELEPGDERTIGETISFSEKEYHNKTIYDTIKEFRHLDQILKSPKHETKLDKQLDAFIKTNHVKAADKNSGKYFTTYTKNGTEYAPSKSTDGVLIFWGSDWKSIDTSINNKMQVITYLEPHIVVDSTRPFRQQKYLWTYEIRGQRIVR